MYASIWSHISPINHVYVTGKGEDLPDLLPIMGLWIDGDRTMFISWTSQCRFKGSQGSRHAQQKQNTPFFQGEKTFFRMEILPNFHIMFDRKPMV